MNPRAASVATLAVLLLATACAGEEPDGAVELPALASSTEADALHYVALGDSWPFGAHCGGCTPFPELYARALESAGPVVFEDLTLDGGTTSDLVAMLDAADAVREDVAEADVVVISVGGNDMEMSGPDWLAGTCGGPDGMTCWRRLARSWERNMGRLLDRVAELREDRPTAVRVLSAANEFLSDEGLLRDFGKDFGREEGATIMAWQKRAFCRAAGERQMKCLDLRPVLNGPELDQPADVNSQASMQAVADALLAMGLPELDADR